MLSILNPLYRLNGVVLDNIYKINNGLIIYEFTAQPALVKNKDGHSLSTEHEQAKRWVEYFKDVLNCSEPDDPASPVPAEEDLEIDLDPPTLEEVKHSIKTL